MSRLPRPLSGRQVEWSAGCGGGRLWGRSRVGRSVASGCVVCWPFDGRHAGCVAVCRPFNGRCARGGVARRPFDGRLVRGRAGGSPGCGVAVSCPSSGRRVRGVPPSWPFNGQRAVGSGRESAVGWSVGARLSWPFSGRMVAAVVVSAVEWSASGGCARESAVQWSVGARLSWPLGGQWAGCVVVCRPLGSRRTVWCGRESTVRRSTRAGFATTGTLEEPVGRRVWVG